jgi:hypothetical protein
MEHRYERLYKQDQLKKAAEREVLEKEIYQAYTFKPQINKISKLIAEDQRSEGASYLSNPEAKKKFL